MRLSEQERLVLSACELDAEASASQIAQRIGCRPHQVNYALRSLREREAIRVRPFINLLALGYSDYGVFLSLAGRKPADRKHVEARMIKQQNIAWCGRMVGEYQYGLAVVVRTLAELERCFEQIEGRNEEIIARKVVCPRSRFRLFPRKYLSRYRPKAEKVFGHTTKTSSLDALDVAILRTLDRLAGSSFREVAQALGANVRTIERRIERLRREGVLLGFFYDISPSALGVETYRVLVTWAGAGRRGRADLLEFCRAQRLVVFLNEELGRWDYEIGIETMRASEVASFHEELVDHFGASISDISVMTEVNTLKWSFYPFS